ncbi:SIS domain-containing protein [Agromyces sp. NPDC058484]|uniref:SIS domain-containing protein n=1 Tax=Agromyces sp. NPDC058484 TaxID=3346524 RepID=UPI0036532D55
MEPSSFIDDLNRVPEELHRVADALEAGLPRLAEVERIGRDAAARGNGVPRVLLLGMGSSNYAADIVAREARESGAHVVAELASTRLLPSAAEDLVVVAISATGGSVEILEAMQPYDRSGRLIAITNKPQSKIASIAGLTIEQHAGVEVSGIACRTFRHTLLVLRAVVAALHPAGHPLRQWIPQLPPLARAAAAANESLLNTKDDWIRPVANALASQTGTWVLAPVERISSARQSALMIREVPRHTAYASETGDWSHVDVYLTKTQDYRALVYAGSAWDEQALGWMRERRSRWVSVGGDLPGAEATVRYPGDDDPRIAQLSELLVAEQVAAHWLEHPDVPASTPERRAG